MFGFIVILFMTPSGHPWIINEINTRAKTFIKDIFLIGSMFKTLCFLRMVLIFVVSYASHPNSNQEIM